MELAKGKSCDPQRFSEEPIKSFLNSLYGSLSGLQEAGYLIIVIENWSHGYKIVYKLTGEGTALPCSKPRGIIQIEKVFPAGIKRSC